jgi:hypothetical protein
MSYSAQWVQLPDFGATWQRGQAINDQREMNALARMMQMRQMDQAQAYENALAGYGAGLASPNDEKRMASAMEIFRSGPQGAAMALPIIQQERDNAAFYGPAAAADAAVRGGGLPIAAGTVNGLPHGERWTPQGASPERSAPATPLPSGGVERVVQVESSGRPDARNPRSSASGILQITDPMWQTYAPRLGLPPERRNDPGAQRAIFNAFAAEQVPRLRQAFGREPTIGDIYAAWALGPAGVQALAANPSEDAFTAYSRAAGPRLAEQAFSGNPGLLERGMTSGQVLSALRARAEGRGAGAPSAPSAGAPAAAPSSPAGSNPMVDPERLHRALELAPRGNQAAIRYLQAVAPFIRQETSSETAPVPDERSPTGWRYVRRAEAAGQAAPAPEGYRPGQGGDNPFGTGGDGRALAELERLAPVVQGGNASEADVRRYLSAAARVQEERVQPDGSRITPRLPAYAPGVDWVAQRYGVRRPAGGTPDAPSASPGTGLPSAEGGSVRAPQATPQTVATAMLENVRALRAAEDATRQILAAPGAVGIGPGLANMVPGVVDRINPSGTSARAALAEIAALKIHDLSGAAVTASEFPRLRPFVPLVSDPPEVVRTKLERFARELRAVLQDQYQAFGPTAGFRVMEPIETALRPRAPGGGTDPPERRAAAEAAIATARRELGANASDDEVVRRAQEIFR